jgi:Ca2+-binding RTX toxin-like protein
VTGAAAGGELKLDSYLPHSVSFLSVTALSDGGFVKTWQSYRQDGSGRDIFGQCLDAAGASTGAVFKVNTTAANSDDQPWPSVTPLADGGFVVTWCCDGQTGHGVDILGQRFDASGAVRGTEFLANATPADSQETPSIMALADDGFVVSWISQGGLERNILAQHFLAPGDPAGEPSLTITGDASSQVLTGLAGNDTITGHSGNDTLNGGAGFDTAVFGGTVASYHFAEDGAQVTISGPDGIDTLTSIEQLQFANLSFSIADRTHFNPLYYLEQNPDVAMAAVDPLTHYRTAGWAEGRDPSPNVGLTAVNGLEYIASYGDLMAAFGVNKAAGYQHFATQGLFEGRNIGFDGLEYIASYGDLINAFHGELAANPSSDVGAQHYILAGHFEGRSADLFDASQYLANYADLQVAFGADTEAATFHYITAGYFEGRTDHAPG